MKRCLILSLLLLAGCAAGPDYRRPEVATPANWKEAGEWLAANGAAPAVATPWWEAYGDAELSALVARVEIDNQNVAVAAAQLRQAQAGLAVAGAARYPTLAAGLSETRARSGEAAATKTDRLALTASWEPDLWGRLGRGVEAGEAEAEASAADFAAALLSARAALVQAWLQLRQNAMQRRLLDQTVAAYARSLEITQNRFQAGVVSRADVAQAETQLHSAKAQLLDLDIARAQLEHAIAVLVGKAPAEFALQLDSNRGLPALPAVPPRLPSVLLERRPDIAAAERRVAAANAQIGVASSAYFPALTLGAGGGWSGPGFANLISLPNRFWSFGPALALTLLDGGARSAKVDEATAAWERSVATYRQTVLSAFQEVEDNLAALAILEREAALQQAAARAAADALALANDQYLAGTVSYLNVVVAQAAALSAERAVVELAGRRLLAGLALLKALGGDWRGAPKS